MVPTEGGSNDPVQFDFGIHETVKHSYTGVVGPVIERRCDEDGSTHALLGLARYGLDDRWYAESTLESLGFEEPPAPLEPPHPPTP